LRHTGRHLIYYSNYRDRTPGFDVPLGFITRTDVRQMKHAAGYKWRPRTGAIVSVGPSAVTLVNWNHDHQLQDASLDLPFWADLKGPTSVAIGHIEILERYADVVFRRHTSYSTLSAQALSSLVIEGKWSAGTGINYYPAAHVAPFVGSTRNMSVGLTWKPSSRLRVSEDYFFSRLAAPLPDRQAAFSDHTGRTRASYQFTREWSLRVIMDAAATNRNSAFVSFDRARRVTFDALATYLVHPGSAIYVGFTTNEELVPGRPPALAPADGDHFTNTGRRFFVKLTRDVSF
jgi:hypothetical protein